MKKSIALLLTVSALVLTGCSAAQDAPKTNSQKSAIESVFAQHAKIRADEGKAGLLSKQGLPGLMAIDVRRCPADFRSAWFDYLVQVQNLHTRMERVAMIAGAEGKPVTDMASLVKFAVANPPFGHYLMRAVDETDDGWNKLDRTAMNYGAMPER